MDISQLFIVGLTAFGSGAGGTALALKIVKGEVDKKVETTAFNEYTKGVEDKCTNCSANIAVRFNSGTERMAGIEKKLDAVITGISNVAGEISFIKGFIKGQEDKK